MKTENTTPFNDFMKFYVLQQKKRIAWKIIVKISYLFQNTKNISKTLQPKNY